MSVKRRVVAVFVGVVGGEGSGRIANTFPTTKAFVYYREYDDSVWNGTRESIAEPTKMNSVNKEVV